MTNLPIDSILPALKNVLRSRESAVLVAAPGAGKTTRVPLALLDEPWLLGRRILMLEPRRLAARSAARYMAALLGEQVGETIGYRVRMDTRVGPNTRIEVITEGVLTRLLQADPALEGVGAVIFDEFHERSLHADLGLALCLQSQSILREDLKILVMSATLEAEPVAALLNDAPVLSSEGRSFPVETHYIPQRISGHMESAVVHMVADALKKEEGDILVFLPGAGEIRRVEAGLAGLKLGRHVHIAPLYGSLSREAQDKAIAPSEPGERKIVLATSIAETSLTVEGVRIIIDSGLMRVPRFSPRTGMTRLETVRVSRASAEQRRGRAGRQAPGVCYRLWTEQDDRYLSPSSTPEILETDLIPLVLELAAWGVSDPAELLWLDLPPAGAFNQAREILIQLGALDEAGTITAHGRRMTELGLSPRLAHMVLKALPLRFGGLACELAALLSERDFFRNEVHAPEADVRLRIEVLRSMGKYSDGSVASFQGHKIDTAVCQRVLSEANYWKEAFRIATKQEKDDIDMCGLLLAFAYPDRIAQRRDNGRFLLRHGRGAAFARVQPLSSAPYLTAAELDDQGAESRIFLAAPVELTDLEQYFSEQIEEDNLITWERQTQSVRARKQVWLGALLLKEMPLTDPDPDDILAALLHGIEEEGLGILPWTKSARQFRQRLTFMSRFNADWPNVTDEALIATLEEWLAPHLYGLKSWDDLQRLDMKEILEAMISWEQRRELDMHVPTHLAVPSGSRITIDYNNPESPVLAVKLQEMFGLKETPCIAGGKVPLTLHLLSPAQRPVQVTQDLASFWKSTYFEVKKDLKGRYPKHYWPDDPLCAEPTNRTRPHK